MSKILLAGVAIAASVTFSADGLGLFTSGNVLYVQGTPRSVPYTATYTVGDSVSFEWVTPVYDVVSTTRYEWWRTVGLSSSRTGSFAVPSGGGTVGIGTESPTSQFHVVGDTDVTGGGAILSGGTDLYNVFSSAGSGISGTGTDNTVPMWNGTTALEDSILTQQ